MPLQEISSALRPRSLRCPSPVLSLYLDTRPDQHGRDNVDAFLRKLPNRAAALSGETRTSFEADLKKIRDYIEHELKPSANGLAIFACTARDGFFEAVQLEAPVEHHWLFIGSGPLDVDTSAPAATADSDQLKLAGELVSKAQQTSARIRFIENAALLADVGGVGALLRFKV